MPLPRLLLLPLAALTVAAAAPTAASAATYSVHTSSSFCSSVAIDEGSDVQAELDAAYGANGPDRVEIGPGQFASGASGYHYVTGISNGNTVDVVGAGRGQTTLSVSGMNNTVL